MNVRLNSFLALPVMFGMVGCDDSSQKPPPTPTTQPTSNSTGDDSPDESYEDFRMGHLVRTAKVWKRLRELGVTEETELVFDFSFDAPTKEGAELLRRALSDYDLHIQKMDATKDQWTVGGKSPPTKFTEKILLKWVDYLIAVGHDNGCKFSGCGASAPNTGRNGGR